MSKGPEDEDKEARAAELAPRWRGRRAPLLLFPTTSSRCPRSLLLTVSAMSTSTFTPTPPDVLRASLERHNATFEALLNLIPARFYLIKEETEEQARPALARTRMLF
jgi:hypothetical protein